MLVVVVLLFNVHGKQLWLYRDQRCKTCIRLILQFLYYKVYNSSCSQVGLDLIDRVKSSLEQIKGPASSCKHILCDNRSAACSGIDASTQ